MDDELEGVAFTSEVPDDLVCGICKDAAIDPQVTEQCGHLFCFECIKKALKHSPSCPLCRKEDIRIRVDHRAKRQVDALPVQCAYPKCIWRGVHSDLEAHREMCVNKIISCNYKQVGCSIRATEEELVSHEKNDTGQHIYLLLKKMQALEQRNDQTEAENNSANTTISQLRNDVRSTREQLRKEEELRLTDKRLHDRQIEKLYSEMASLRSSLNQNSTTTKQITEWRSDSKQFTISNGGLTATHCIPGWATLLCKDAVCKGVHNWKFEISCSGHAFIPSTVMVGVTSTTNILSTHLGNVSSTWCFQDNGFRWDGLQCFAYGEPFTEHDIIGIHLDFNTGILEFSKNGKSFGQAFTEVGGLLYPAVSLCTEGHGISIIT